MQKKREKQEGKKDNLLVGVIQLEEGGCRREGGKEGKWSAEKEEKI